MKVVCPPLRKTVDHYSMQNRLKSLQVIYL